MNKFTKFAALIMALVLCLSFAACGGKEEPETTAVEETTVDVIAPVEDETTAAEETTVEETTVEETTVEETTAASTMPEGEEAIVEYFNAAVNKVKTDAKSVDQKHVTNYLAASPTIPSALNGIYKLIGGDGWLDDTLKANGQGAATYTGDDIDAKFPVEGESWASKLTTSDIKSAKCTEDDGVYTITIVTKADGKSDSVKHGQGHNPKVHNVVLPGVVNDNIPGPAVSLVGLAAMDYPYGEVVITVDAETGNVKTADYDVQWSINFDKMGAIVPLGTRSSYVVTF